MPEHQPLTPQQVHGLRWDRFKDFRHSRHLHWVAITAPEASRVAAELPLIFVTDTQGQTQLHALLSLQAQQNFCLNEHNQWQLDYTPALLRTHPFSIQPPKGGKPTERTLCIDIDSPWVHPQGQNNFFDTKQAQPQLSSSVQEVLNFLKELELHRYKTQQACNHLAELKLLKPLEFCTLQGTYQGTAYQIDEPALNQLKEKALFQLRKTGGLALAYTQMISSHQVRHLQKASQDHNSPHQDVDLDQVFGEASNDTFKF
ncbi:SapC family protein [Marinospirillum sp. MEB164]|uniref:SapC family protein n=1 Tax=Marinospirillum alkalitolerans TaxID=3123374 RepID=A0ABW8PW12_9GAMM